MRACVRVCVRVIKYGGNVFCYLIYNNDNRHSTVMFIAK